MSHTPSYIIAARRTAIGRVGGLHRNRRVEALAAPVVEAALNDAGLQGDAVDEVIIGNATLGGNPARLIALAAGIHDTASASTIDRQCGSGLDAILSAIRIIGSGEADVIVAGGAESPSTAPWRIAKPKSLYSVPHFIGVEPSSFEDAEEPQLFEASEALAGRFAISRGQQDAYALRSHLNARKAHDERRFVGEIVPLRATPEEARDQSAIDPSLEELERLQPFMPPKGTLTPGNTSAMHDGAAIVVIVSQAIYDKLGQPPALRLVNSATQGVPPGQEADAPIFAMNKLYQRLNGFDRSAIKVVEIAETSSAQAIALGNEIGLSDDIVNPGGGEIVRGHPFGASGAVLIVRLFTTLCRTAASAPGDSSSTSQSRYGIATQGAIGGLGLAALFEAV